MKLHAEADPEDGRPPLLLVHGMMSSRHHWQPNRSLSETFRLVTVDLPAHGLSSAPQDKSEAVPSALVQALETVRDQLQIDRWHVCGQSFGAGITLLYALTFPERVITQVFTNANGAVREAWEPSLEQQNQNQVDDIRRDGYAAMRRLAYHPSHAKRFPADLRETLSRDADATDVNGIALLMAHATPRLSVRDRLGELRMPTLLVNGLWERKFQPARKWIADTHPHIKVLDLEGGHSINIECSDQFNTAVAEFLLAGR
jgi:pimeloyl-ACP methyl ester carboxylesterase